MSANQRVTVDQMIARWDSSERPLFKGELISEDGCCCAQGDVLRCYGFTNERLRYIGQDDADEYVAKILGISRAESILLRTINDEQDGCPQDVFRNREKILGKHHKLWTAFAKYIDTLGKEDWQSIIKKQQRKGTASYAATNATAEVVSPIAVYETASKAARLLGSAAMIACDATGVTNSITIALDCNDSAAYAAYELLGWSALDKPYFLCFFFDDPVAWVKKHE